MAFRITTHVQRGWLDASTKGRIVGEIYLKGRELPMRLSLDGLPMADIAGRIVSFENPDAHASAEPLLLAEDQEGTAGDVTASRKLLDGDISRGREALQIVNGLYVEWYSQRNGRILIEATTFKTQVHGEPTWILTDQDELERQEQVAEGMADFMNRVASAAEEFVDEIEDEIDDTPMDEFEWEKSLKESDERTARYGELLEKYHDHPDCERIVAREMGWDHLEDMLDADERGIFDEAQAQSDDDEEDLYPEPTPDPAREGVDWIRTEDGDISHPLSHRAFELSSRLHHRVKQMESSQKRALETESENVQLMIFATRMLSAKLAGALNGLAYDRDLSFTAGMIVAQLKRALNHFNETSRRMSMLCIMQPDWFDILRPYQDELFSIREEMLHLMERFRQAIRSPGQN